MYERKTFKTIRVEDLHTFLCRDDLLLLDVRDAKAYAQGHIPGARNVTIANLASVLERTVKTIPILIYCYHGYASQEFAQIFCDFRFQQVYSLDGGFAAWHGATKSGTHSKGFLSSKASSAAGFRPNRRAALALRGR